VNLNNMSNDEMDSGTTVEQQLALLNSLTREEFDQAERLINAKLQASLDSLEQSAAAVRLLLAAQTPADLASPAGMAMRSDLESLLASSIHLSRLASMTQEGFSNGRAVSAKRTEQEIAKVVDAVQKHRVTVQDNAIAMTQSALDKARAPSPLNHASRAVERRPR
jgi:hypothetical protein